MHFDNVLYILGNGFDLHHDVRSSYGDFSRWIKKSYPEIYEIYDAVCEYDALWSDFETSMAYVSRNYLLENGEIFLPDPKKDPDDYTMADIVMGGDYARETAEDLLDNLRTCLHRWINTIKAPHSYNLHKLYIDAEARFLVFNYTNFLESHYGIERERINYIHGRKTDKWGSLILGHGEDNDAIFDNWWKERYERPHYNNKGKIYYRRDSIYHAYHDDGYLPEYEMITDAVESYFHDAQKPVKKILIKQDEYFQSLSNIRYIYVWGYSFAGVDMPYIHKIAEVNKEPENLKWYISYYNEKDRERALSQMRKISVNEYNIQFQKLQNLEVNSQAIKK